MADDIRTRLSEALDEAEVDVKDCGHVWLFGDQICGNAALRLVERDRQLLADITPGGERHWLASRVLEQMAAFWLGTPEVDR